MPVALVELGQIILIIGGLLGIILSLIKISDWWRNNQTEVDLSPDLVLEWNEELMTQSSQDTEVYSLVIKNHGKITAEDVEIRLYKTEQDGVNFMKLNDRYILHRSESIKVGDSIPFTFIHDSKRIGKLITPAGNDRIFLRIDSVFTFHIVGINFETVIQKMAMKLDASTDQFKIISL